MRTLLALALLSLPLAGCLSGTTDDIQVPDRPVRVSATTVVALIDTGINPYHEEFRDPSDLARVHPSQYLPGFPADAPALDLTLDAEDYETAVRADCDVWQNVEEGTLYWVPGTRIAGAITFDAGSTACGDELPGAILDRQGHGTMVASRVAGQTSGLCATCRIVAVQGFHSDHMLWAAQQPFIDAQSNSWGALPINHGTGLQGFDRDDVIAAAARQPVFVAGGNGLLGFFGVAGHPAYFDDIAGASGVIMVGGHNEGQFTPWTMTMPHVVADADGHPAAEHDSLTTVGPCRGGGTSGATPFAAGTFAAMLLAARDEVGDLGVGVRDGAVVVADGLPDNVGGPLDDGVLTMDEARTAFFHSADPRPAKDGARDGDGCEASPLYPTLPVAWQDVPEEAPAYYFVGYGQVGERTLQGHIDVVLGRAEAPDRSTEDGFYDLDNGLRGLTDQV